MQVLSYETNYVFLPSNALTRTTDWKRIALLTSTVQILWNLDTLTAVKDSIPW